MYNYAKIFKIVGIFVGYGTTQAT